MCNIIERQTYLFKFRFRIALRQGSFVLTLLLSIVYQSLQNIQTRKYVSLVRPQVYIPRQKCIQTEGCMENLSQKPRVQNRTPGGTNLELPPSFFSLPVFVLATHYVITTLPYPRTIYSSQYVCVALIVMASSSLVILKLVRKLMHGRTMLPSQDVEIREDAQPSTREPSDRRGPCKVRSVLPSQDVEIREDAQLSMTEPSDHGGPCKVRSVLLSQDVVIREYTQLSMRGLPQDHFRVLVARKLKHRRTIQGTLAGLCCLHSLVPKYGEKSCYLSCDHLLRCQ